MCLFTQASTICASEAVNAGLKKVVDFVDSLIDGAEGMFGDGINSHQIRHTTAQRLSENIMVSMIAIIQRGGWTLTGVHQVFKYFAQSEHHDDVSARALTGHPDTRYWQVTSSWRDHRLSY